jgi:hypothetical protein
MQESIDALFQKDQFILDSVTEWLSKPVVVPKLHQENISVDKINELI